MKNLRYCVIIVVCLVAVCLFFGLSPFAYAAPTNPNLFVSAENSMFDNHFAGSMVIEVVIIDNTINETGEGNGEPDVSFNGKSLRMVQATDGNWYAYFANVGKAKIADQISFTGGVPGQGLDFGVFCDRGTDASVLGIDFSETDGVAIPSSSGITGFTNGESSFSECVGALDNNRDNLNNIVRHPKSINTNGNVLSGQIGLNPNAWPMVQLFSFRNVVITYNPGGPSQTVNLEYDEIQNIVTELDRDVYPSNSEVFVTISDIQLNQDPTDEDSWTFSVGNTAGDTGTFYQAFDENGINSANGGTGLVNLVPHLAALGFDENGSFDMSLDSIIQLDSNGNQPTTSISDGTRTYSDIVTFIESQPNTGIFVTYDNSDNSVIKIVDNVKRGLADFITYNDDSISILSGFSTASISTGLDQAVTLSDSSTWSAGTEIPISITDFDQNLNTGSRDSLDLYTSSDILPTIVINNPVTLEFSSDVMFYEFSTIDVLSSDGIFVPSTIFDKNSVRLLLETESIQNTNFEKISINLGIPATRLHQILIDNSDNIGTNWLNYDLRSFGRQLELDGDNIGDTSISLYFGDLADEDPITIVDSGDLSQLQGLIRIDNDAVSSIMSKSGTVFAVINFDYSDDSITVVGRVFDETDRQPIVLDIFSFGIKNGQDINNAIYRFELEESLDNSGIFEGTFEYAIANQLNIATSDLFENIRPIDDQIKFVVTNRLLDEEGITISYSDISNVGNTIPTATKSPILTNSGTVSTDASSYGFGRPVTIILNDPDLNLKNDRIDIYLVIDDPDSENVDTVGNLNGASLLEVKIKGTRYQRCTVDGTEHGGLAATGFTLVETSSSSGIFEGVFKMPSRICNEKGTDLIYTSGGNIDVKYFDFRDSLGQQNTVTLSRQKTLSSTSPPITPTPQSPPPPTPSPPSLDQQPPQLNFDMFNIPKYSDTTEVILTGSINGHKRGVPVAIILIGPDNTQNDFAVYPTSSGSYRTVFLIDSDFVVGQYNIRVLYQDVKIGSTSFDLVAGNQISSAIQTQIQNWSTGVGSDASFRDSIRSLAKQKIIDVSPSNDSIPSSSFSNDMIPSWVKNTSKWWSDGIISDDEYLLAIEFLVKKGIIRI